MGQSDHQTPNTSLSEVTLVPFDPAHLDGAAALSSAAGWPHQRNDWAMLLPMSRGVAANQGGRVVGTALRSTFGPSLATLNMIIVDRSCRSQGLGRKLVTHVIEGDQSALRLIATASGRPLYESLGFTEVGSIACVQGVVAQGRDAHGVFEATADDLAAIAQIESDSFGGDRAMLVDWLWQNARLAVIRPDGAGAGLVAGYAACRLFGNGHVIGPVVAQSASAALDLIGHLVQDLVGQPLRLDVGEGHGLEAALSQLGLSVAYRAPVMARGGGPASDQRFAIFSQALG